MMKSCARAPVRVDPAGGGTDAPPYCVDYGGAVVNFAVQRHAYAMAQKLEPGSGIVIGSLDLGKVLCVDNVAQLPGRTELEFIKAFVQRLVPEEDSLLLLTDTDVPAGSGLGGSGALGVAIVAALDLLYGRQRLVMETAALANEVERVDLNYPGGSQDSYGAARGGFNLLQYQPGGGMTARSLTISPDTLRALEYQSLLIYCGASHVSASIHEDIKRSYDQENSPTVAAMHRLRELALGMATQLESDDLKGYAESLTASCHQLYQLHDSCNSTVHQRMFDAIADCILGGKTCGAGGGGFLVVLARPERRQECVRRAEELGGLVWPVSIDQEGLVTWQDAALTPEDILQLREFAG